jgi:hypothetical protein
MGQSKRERGRGRVAERGGEKKRSRRLIQEVGGSVGGIEESGGIEEDGVKERRKLHRFPTLEAVLKKDVS